MADHRHRRDLQTIESPKVRKNNKLELRFGRIKAPL